MARGGRRRTHRKRGGEFSADKLKTVKVGSLEEGLQLGSETLRGRFGKAEEVSGEGTGTRSTRRSLSQERKTEVARAEHLGVEPPKLGGRKRKTMRRRRHTRKH